MAEDPTPGVQSVQRAFALLEVLADADGGISLSELAERSDLPLPTIHRLLRTLGQLGHVRQLPNRRYGLGPGLIRIGETAGRQLGSWARPHLQVLVDGLGETANFAVLDGDLASYVAQVPSAHSMRTFTQVGRHVPTHASGVGKAMLAQLADDEVRALLTRAGMPRATAHTLGSIEEVLADLVAIRARGFAVDEGEQEIGVRCYAVPVIGLPTPAAVSVSGPDARVDEAFARRAVPQLVEAAEGIRRSATP